MWLLGNFNKLKGNVMKKQTIPVLVCKVPVILLLGSFAVAMSTTVVQAQSFPPVQETAMDVQSSGVLNRAVQARPSTKVQAPPRPLGSDKVTVAVGLNPLEIDREKRAHSHSKLVKKDFTRDDTLPTPKTK